MILFFTWLLPKKQFPKETAAEKKLAAKIAAAIGKVNATSMSPNDKLLVRKYTNQGDEDIVLSVIQRNKKHKRLIHKLWTLEREMEQLQAKKK